MRKQITHISVHQSSKVVAAVLTLLFAIFAIIPFALYTMIMEGDFYTGLIMLVGAPIFYGIIFYIGHVITYWIYNLIARHLGGVEFDIADLGEEHTLANPNHHIDL